MTPINRRRFLAGAGTAAVGTAAASAGLASTASGAANPTPGEIVAGQGLLDRVPFDGRYQAGILTPRQDQITIVALDSLAPSRSALALVLQELTGRMRALATGGPAAQAPLDAPPPDSGTIGPVILPDQLTITVAFGPSLFDARYGLAAQRPPGLIEMPRFTNDEIDPARAGGDLLLQICANHRDTVVHAFREIMRVLDGSFAIRWTLDGFVGENRGPSARSSTRNLFAFRDGTANPDVTDSALMHRLVWVNPGQGPAWAVDGTFQVIRTIRMHVEFWDRVGLEEQQTMIGRVRTTGAPLGGTNEFENPRYDLDPHGRRIPLNAHIRLANPRTNATANRRILRRSYSYHRGIDAAGTLDQGLLFVAFNQDPARQYAVIQKKLSIEPMIDYITPVGGGYYFAPPGTGGPRGWLGESLFAT
ncbi:MAG TPA: Dyp-type peroxidase [Solirubrobacteraceae bacterium]|nr:Dyp-type peroxidase [Solirubrobacteraceae bacterium]